MEMNVVRIMVGSHNTSFTECYALGCFLVQAFRDLLDEAGKASQFYLELQDLKALEREEQPRIFHLNPWLKGDWSGKPVTEQNTCYRMQWGSSTKM
ncbi:unnamed protein product [Brassica oleracea var. botrytis]|uniref:(rape) hypothetical protein n=1 Tax=Brassica napus TaxID=3708 RepID=A0A816IL15_BRANA|nr:unnamed protein product [Brassica napus]